jgi:hypothetical protein
MKLEFSQQIFEKYSDIEFYEYLSSMNRVIFWGRMNGQTDTDRQRDMTRLIVAFHNFAKASKNY